MIIENVTHGVELASRAKLADSWLARAVGLLRHSSLPVGEALVIKPCQSVHTFFMRFPIDVLFVDKRDRVLHAIPALKPCRVSRIVWRASYVVELPAGTIESSGTQVGDTLALG